MGQVEDSCFDYEQLRIKLNGLSNRARWTLRLFEMRYQVSDLRGNESPFRSRAGDAYPARLFLKNARNNEVQMGL
jgi:hypothetical protein